MSVCRKVMWPCEVPVVCRSVAIKQYAELFNQHVDRSIIQVYGGSELEEKKAKKQAAWNGTICGKSIPTVKIRAAAQANAVGAVNVGYDAWNANPNAEAQVSTYENFCHEFMHVLGFEHEQYHPYFPAKGKNGVHEHAAGVLGLFADNYVRVLEVCSENIAVATISLQEVLGKVGQISLNCTSTRQWDAHSVMLYPLFLHTVESLAYWASPGMVWPPLMDPLYSGKNAHVLARTLPQFSADGSVLTSPGERGGMSELDIACIRAAWDGRQAEVSLQRAAAAGAGAVPPKVTYQNLITRLTAPAPPPPSIVSPPAPP